MIIHSWTKLSTAWYRLEGRTAETHREPIMDLNFTPCIVDGDGEEHLHYLHLRQTPKPDPSASRPKIKPPSFLILPAREIIPYSNTDTKRCYNVEVLWLHGRCAASRRSYIYTGPGTIVCRSRLISCLWRSGHLVAWVVTMISVNRLPLVFRGASKAVIARLRIHVDETEMYVSYSLVNLSKSRTQKGNIN